MISHLKSHKATIIQQFLRLIFLIGIKVLSWFWIYFEIIAHDLF